MKKPACLLLFVLASFAVAPAFAQDVPPPPRPADSGPSLADTLKFIEEKLADEGKRSYTATVTDTAQQGVEWNNKFTTEITTVAADAKACQLSFHWRAEVNGKVSDDKDYTLSLKDVRDVVVLPQEQNQKQVDTRAEHATWSSKITPNVFTLVARRPRGVENAFLFSEEDMAGRVAKAMVHAVELCGGGKAEPF